MHHDATCPGTFLKPCRPRIFMAPSSCALVVPCPDCRTRLGLTLCPPASLLPARRAEAPPSHLFFMSHDSFLHHSSWCRGACTQPPTSPKCSAVSEAGSLEGSVWNLEIQDCLIGWMNCLQVVCAVLIPASPSPECLFVTINSDFHLSPMGTAL